MELGPIYSTSGAYAEGLGVACPLLPEHFVTLNSKAVLRKIIKAGRLGERFGARIIGLGGFTSVFGNEGEEVAKYLRVAVTSGNTYTAALAIEGILTAAQRVGHRPHQSSLAIIGATGDIGSICAKVLSQHVAKVYLSARNQERLKDFSEQVMRNTSAEVYVTKYTAEAIKEADLILTATSALTTLIEPEDLRAGAIVCDVSYPANITRDISRYRNDVLVFEGGLATWPFYHRVHEVEKLALFAPPGIIHGCLAETIILALERRFENFSIGRGLITENRIEQIVAIAKRHGFRLAPFHCGTNFYTDEDIDRVRKALIARTNSENRVVGAKQESYR